MQEIKLPVASFVVSRAAEDHAGPASAGNMSRS